MGIALPLAVVGNGSVGLIIFGLTYLGIAFGRIPGTKADRSTIAFLGAVAVLAARRLNAEEALGSINFPTLALLFSLMVLSAQLKVAGFYTWVVIRMVAAAHRPWHLLIGLVAASAVLSAIFANDIVCLAFAPVLCVAMRRAGRNAVPYLIALATSSNIGSAATLIGNPQNMLIGQMARLGFAHYTLVALPLVVVCLAINVLVVAAVYREALFGAAVEIHLEKLHEELQLAVHPRMIAKALVLTVVLMAAFVSGLNREIAGLVVAGVILVSRRSEPRQLLALVDWNLMLLFVGLFIVIGDAQQHGLLRPALDWVGRQGIAPDQHGPLAAVTVVLANVVSNVPAVLLLGPGIDVHATYLWYLLAIVSTFAGNLTLLGSIANLIVVEQAKTEGVEISFVEYLKLGVPLTVVTVGLAVGYMAFFS